MSMSRMIIEGEDVTVQPQTIVIMRHGDRYDFDMGSRAWEKIAIRLHDPPLSADIGHAQVLDQLAYYRLLRETEPNLQITKVLTSPFLRCITTAHPIAEAWDAPLLIEDSLWEVSGQGETMASAVERACYFPRIDVHYKSIFRPEIDEVFPAGVLERYGRAAYEIERRFLQGPDRQPGIAICTHGAGVVAIVSALLRVSMDDINPATPCAIYRLERASSNEPWRLREDCGLVRTDGSCDGKGAQVCHLKLSQSLLMQQKQYSKTGPWPVRTARLDPSDLVTSSYSTTYPTRADLWLEAGEKASWLNT